MPRIASGNELLGRLRAEGFLSFNEEKAEVVLTLVRTKDGKKVAAMFPVSDFVNITTPGLEKHTKGLDPAEGTRAALRSLLSAGIDTASILAMLTKEKEKIDADNAVTILPGTEPAATESAVADNA